MASERTEGRKHSKRLARDSLPAPTAVQAAVNAYLVEHVEGFRDVEALRARGWANPEGDKHFRRQRRTADGATDRTARFFFRMMQRIGTAMNRETGAFEFTDMPGPKIMLDLCMAPGGFVASVLDRHPAMHARAFSLPVEQGGHRVLLDDPVNCNVTLADITMLAGDMGVVEADVPVSHPDFGNFRFDKYLSDEDMFDLVVCDGQVLRTHRRESYRESCEAQRLSCTQLALGLEHVKDAGTMVILLHKLESVENLKLLSQFDQCSDVQVFKSWKFHAARSSFYLIAKDVRRNSPLVADMVSSWKAKWKIATFGTDEERTEMFRVSEEDALAILEKFGQRYADLGRDVWRTQARALENAPYVQ